jgi:hypothetical protein
MMTDAGKAEVWKATYLPFGGVHQITGTASLDARLPGQWFKQQQFPILTGGRTAKRASLARLVVPYDREMLGNRPSLQLAPVV